MTIKDLLENDKVDFNLPIEEFVKKYVFEFNLSEEQLKTKDEIYSLMFYGFMIATRWHIKISLEEIVPIRKAQYNLKYKNIQILKERLLDNKKFVIFNFEECKDSEFYSDVEGSKYINTHFKDKTLYNRYMSFYSIGFLVGLTYTKKKFDKIFSTTIAGTKISKKKSLIIKDSTLPEFIDEFNSFIINNKKILKLK